MDDSERNATIYECCHDVRERHEFRFVFQEGHLDICGSDPYETFRIDKTLLGECLKNFPVP